MDTVRKVARSGLLDVSPWVGTVSGRIGVRGFVATEQRCVPGTASFLELSLWMGAVSPRIGARSLVAVEQG
jgi:hypothetical protein